MKFSIYLNRRVLVMYKKWDNLCSYCTLSGTILDKIVFFNKVSVEMDQRRLSKFENFHRNSIKTSCFFNAKFADNFRDSFLVSRSKIESIYLKILMTVMVKKDFGQYL